MAKKTIGTLLTAAALLVGSPALAQDEILTDMSPESAAAGYRIDGSAGDFQVVTHGIWKAPVQIAGPVLIPIQPSGLGPSKPRRIQKTPTNQPSFRRAAYLPHVYAAEAQYGLPTGLLDALIWTESRYNPFAISGAGAAGLGQLMPKTARELGVANRFDPRANLWAAARYLRQMLDKFGVVHLAVAAYNAGPGAVERAGGIPLNGETPSYVRNVLSFWGDQMSSSYGNGSSTRKRVSGVLNHGGRGLNILTDAGDLWVLDREDVDPELLGRRVTAEGTQAGYDRLHVEWIGEV